MILGIATLVVLVLFAFVLMPQRQRDGQSLVYT